MKTPDQFAEPNEAAQSSHEASLEEAGDSGLDNGQSSASSVDSANSLARRLSHSVPAHVAPSELTQFVSEGSKCLLDQEQDGNELKRPAESASQSCKKARTESVSEIHASGSLAPETGLVEYGQMVCQKMIDHQGKGKVFFAQGNQGSVNQTFFEPLDTPFSWRARDGVKASDAIKAFFGGPSAIECGSFLVACQLDGLREYLGDDLFNQHFGDGTEKGPLTGRLEIKPDLYEIESLRSKTNFDVLGQQQGIQIGQKVYLSNTPRYGFRHPYGVAQGENLAYRGDNTFVGFGLGGQAYTLDQVQDTLFLAYASGRDENEANFIDELIKSPELTPQQIQNFKAEGKVQVSKEQIVAEMELSLGLMLIPSRFL